MGSRFLVHPAVLLHELTATAVETALDDLGGVSLSTRDAPDVASLIDHVRLG